MVWVICALLSGCASQSYTPEFLAYRQRLEGGFVAPEDIERFRVTPLQQQSLVASAQSPAMVAYANLDVALKEAAASGNLAEIKKLLNAGAHVGAVDVWGNTPLLIAAREGHTECVRLLLKAGAPVDGRDGAMTPLAAAALRGHLATVRLLVSKGADVNAGGLAEQSPLVQAVKLNRIAVAQTLLKAGASRQQLDRSGDNLLIMAVNNNSPSMISMLISEGMDPDTPDGNGLTPLYWSDYLKHADAAIVLRAAGGTAVKQKLPAAINEPYVAGGY